MKNIIVLISLLFSTAIYADSLANFFRSDRADFLCKKAKIDFNNGQKKLLQEIVHSDKYIIFAFGDSSQSLISINDYSGIEIHKLALEGKVQDIKITNDIMYVLTSSKILAYNTSTFEELASSRTLPDHFQYSKYIRAYEMHLHNEMIYIAHGEIGVIKMNADFELDHLIPVPVPQPSNSQISYVTGITGNNSHLFLGIDNKTYDFSTRKRAFEGVAIMGISSEKVTNTVSVNQRREAYHVPLIDLIDGHLYIHNLGIYFKHNPKKLMTSNRHLNPLHRIFNFSEGYIVGRGILKNNKMYGCFEKKDTMEIISGVSTY